MVRSIGGRYSALSDFGMVPAALMGLDVTRLLDRADDMVQACAGCVPAPENPGLVLGTILGTLGRRGRNKVTLVTSPGIWDLGAWLEQLLAESTGKDGLGLIPIDGETPGTPDVYGDDRVFVYLRLTGEADTDQDAAVARLEDAGQPVVRIEIDDRYVSCIRRARPTRVGPTPECSYRSRATTPWICPYPVGSTRSAS